MKKHFLAAIKPIANEFKEFAVRSNVIDVAIGMLIGAGVTPIASSLVSDIIMPPVAYLLGNADLSNLFVIVKSGTPHGPYPSLLMAKEAGAVTINYGKFLNTIFSFLAVAFVAFGIVKGSNALERKLTHDKQSQRPKTKSCKYCQSKIPSAAIKCPHCTADIEDRLHPN